MTGMTMVGVSWELTGVYPPVKMIFRIRPLLLRRRRHRFNNLEIYFL